MVLNNELGGKYDTRYTKIENMRVSEEKLYSGSVVKQLLFDQNESYS
jgi:hypothetical protein